MTASFALLQYSKTTKFTSNGKFDNLSWVTVKKQNSDFSSKILSIYSIFWNSSKYWVFFYGEDNTRLGYRRRIDAKRVFSKNMKNIGLCLNKLGMCWCLPMILELSLHNKMKKNILFYQRKNPVVEIAVFTRKNCWTINKSMTNETYLTYKLKCKALFLHIPEM